MTHSIAQVVAWLVALAWIARVAEAWRKLPTIPDLLLPEHDLTPPGSPTLTVIVPARNEENDVGACLRSLLAQDYPRLQIIAINDRSTDRTGDIITALAAQAPQRLTALHITELPPGWLGKTHAMAQAAQGVTSDLLLFTDADVLFRPDCLRRALAEAVSTEADHLVLLPTTLSHRWDEAAFLAFFATVGTLVGRPWKVPDPTAREHIGVGAFNLIRRDAYRRIGGFESLRMAVIEDLGLGRRVKAAGLRQRVALGRGLVSIHWASGIRGLTGVLTKNLFSAFNFHTSLVILASLSLALFAVVPFAALFYPATASPAGLTVLVIACAYRLLSPISGRSAWNALATPLIGCVMLYALLRSLTTTLAQGGVIWRGTFYSLAELRNHTEPLW